MMTEGNKGLNAQKRTWSQIAALLLMYLNDEEDAFWGLSQLMVMNKYAMHGEHQTG